jgi:hypothetical protein
VEALRANGGGGGGGGGNSNALISAQEPVSNTPNFVPERSTPVVASLHSGISQSREAYDDPLGNFQSFLPVLSFQIEQLQLVLSMMVLD